MVRLWSIAALGAALCSVSSALALPAVSAAVLEERTFPPTSFVQGTYNYSSFGFQLPLAQARRLLPSKYATLPDEQVFLRISGAGAEKTTLAVIETGRQEGNGPPGLPVLNNEESKLQLPYIKRLSNSAQPFIFKSNIFVDSVLAAGSGTVVFGLKETVAAFQPPNSATAPSYDTSTVGWFDISSVSTTSSAGSLNWTEIANMPWFSEGPLCGRHQYAPSSFSTGLNAGEIKLYGQVLKQASPVVLADLPGIRNVAVSGF